MSGRPPLRTNLGPDSRTMARGAAANVGGALLTTVLSFALSLLITHQISATAFGLYSIALVTVLLAQVPATLGLDVGTVRFVALRASAGDAKGARATLQAALVVVAVASGALTALLYWQAPWLTESFFRKEGGADLVRVVALSLPALSLTRVAIGGLQGLGRMRYSALVNPVRVAANIAVALPVLLLGHGAHGLAVAFLASSWATLLVAVALLLGAMPSALVPTRGWELGALLRFSLPQTLTTLLMQTILWTDTVLLGRLRTAADVAVYTIAQRLLSPGQTVSTATGQMFAPRIAAQDDRRTLDVMLKRVTFWNTALAIPVFALLLLLATPLMGIFGHDYERGATALAILAGGQLFNAATGPLGQVINMSGRPYLTLLNNAAVAGLNIVACLILIPRYGLTGAAIATTSSITLVNLIKLVQVWTLFGIYPFRRDTLHALGAGVLATAVTAPVALLPRWPSPLLEVLVCGTLFLTLYAVFFWRAAGGGERRELLRLRNQAAAAGR